MKGKHFSKAVYFAANEYNGFHEGRFPWRDPLNQIAKIINNKYRRK